MNKGTGGVGPSGRIGPDLKGEVGAEFCLFQLRLFSRGGTPGFCVRKDFGSAHKRSMRNRAGWNAGRLRVLFPSPLSVSAS
jgi:hypothetical protein